MSTDIPENVKTLAAMISEKILESGCDVGSQAFEEIIASAIMEARDKALDEAAVVADEEAAGCEWQRSDCNAQSDKRGAYVYESMALECRQIALSIRAMKSTEREDFTWMVRVLTDGEESHD